MIGENKMTEKTTIQVKETIDYLHLHRQDMTAAQMRLVDSLKQQFRRNKDLSDKQVKILLDIKKFLYD